MSGMTLGGMVEADRRLRAYEGLVRREKKRARYVRVYLGGGSDSGPCAETWQRGRGHKEKGDGCEGLEEPCNQGRATAS